MREPKLTKINCKEIQLQLRAMCTERARLRVDTKILKMMTSEVVNLLGPQAFHLPTRPPKAPKQTADNRCTKGS